MTNATTTRKDAEKIVKFMDELMCSKCSKNETGCTPGEIIRCTELLLAMLNSVDQADKIRKQKRR